MKALVLAGGRGSRLDELSSNRNKCMISVMGKHVIEYNLENAANTDIEEIIIVVGYRAEEIINKIGTEYQGKKIRYVIQPEQKGLVNAMECAKEALEGHDFLLLLGDEILINPRYQTMINMYKSSECAVVCGVLEVGDRNLIKRTYTIIQDTNNNVYRLIEKPRTPLNNIMGTGDCVFSNDIFNYIKFTPVHFERKEKELPDLIQCAIDEGKVVKTFMVCDKYTNINTKEDIHMAEGFFQDHKNTNLREMP